MESKSSAQEKKALLRRNQWAPNDWVVIIKKVPQKNHTRSQKPHKDPQKLTRIYKSTHRTTKAHKDSKKLTKIHKSSKKNSQKFTKTHKSTQRPTKTHTKAHKSSQRPTQALF